MNLKWFREKWSHFSLPSAITQCPTKYTYVPRNPASGRTWWLERSISLNTHFAAKDSTAIKGAIPCYLLSFQKTSIQLNFKNNGPALLYLLPSMARMDWNFKKLRQRLQVLMLSPQNHKKYIMVSAFWWNLLSSSSHLYTRAFCAWENTQSIIVTLLL